MVTFHMIERKGETITADEFLAHVTGQKAKRFFTDVLEEAEAELRRCPGARMASFAVGRLE